MKAIAISLAVLLSAIMWGCSELNKEPVTGINGKCRLCHEVPPQDRMHTAHTMRQTFDCGVCHNPTYN